MSIMSKPTTRIMVSVLIALILLIALYTSVQGGLNNKVIKAEPNSAQAHAVDGLKTNLNHDRSTIAELESAVSQSDPYMQPSGRGHGGCEDEVRVNPSDL